ncbi:Zinc finger protein, partial [Operophtera brumata]
MFTTNTVQAGSVPTLQYQDHPSQKSQGKIIENAQQKNAQQTQQSQQQQQEFPTFCYTTNVNMIGKIGTAATSGTGGVNITQLTTSDDKTCYIAQPFSYNYALVNQMQIAPNGLQNTISNISFKCDVCGLMFGHLTLLNAHKRIHTQDTDGNITVVATGVGGGNEVAMNPHIQILSSDSNDQQQHHVQLQDSPKLIRCENCIAQDSVDQQRNNQMNNQIFVAEENVKFEVGTVNAVHSVQPTTDPLAAQPQPTQQQTQQAVKTLPGGHHPVKKRNLASVTKCQNCNGSGIIFVGGIKNKLNQNSAEKPFHCNICGGSFSRYSSLWSHKKLHSGEKNFKCGICGIAFAKAVCETCGSAFSQAAHLKNHAKVHSGEKPFKCDICTAAFAD